MKTLLLLIIAVIIGGVVFMGCSKDEGDATAKQASQGASQAWDKTKEVAGQIGKSVSKTAAQVAETTKIKGPIDASKDVDSSQVSVETIGKTVLLAGSVPTAAEKAKVEQMVHANMDKEYTLDDHLKVAAPKPADAKPAKADDSSPK